MAASISIIIEPVSVQIQSGGRASARLTFLNRGDTVGQYALSVSGVDTSWAKLDSAQVGVFPGDRSVVQLRLRLPAEGLAATYRVVIQAQNQLDAADRAQSVLELTVSRGADAATGLPVTDTKPRERVSSNQQADMGQAQPTVIRSQQAMPPGGSPPLGREARGVFGEAVLKAASSSGQVMLAADREGLKLTPGAAQSLHLALSNTGGVAVAMELAVKGAPLSWLGIAPASLALAPGETQVATLTADLPLQTPLGSYPLTILASSGEDASLSARLNMMLEVTKAGDIALELVPLQAQGELSGEFAVRLSQTGQTSMSVALSARDAGGQLDYAFSPPSVVLPASGSASSRLLVRPRAALTGTDSLTIAFEVTAATGSGGAAAASAQGRFVQQRGVPAKLLLPGEDVRDPASAAFPLRIVNPGRSTAAYRLSASDPGGNCRCQFENPLLNIPAQGEAATVLYVSPLAFLNAGELIHTIQVTAQPVSGPGVSLTGSLRFIQTAGQPPVMTLSPASQTSPGPASYSVQVYNPRAVPLQIVLQPYDQNQQCQFVIDLPNLMVPAQGSASARLEVTPLGQLLSGETKRVYPFGVAGYVDNQPTPILAEGTLLQVHGFTWRKLLPIFVITFILLALGAAAVLTLLYLRFMP